MEGTCRKFISERGFGFLRGDDGIEVFVHASAIIRDDPSSFKTLKEGQRVTYEIEQHAKGTRAKNVRVIETKGE